MVELRACTITVCEYYFSLFMYHISNFEPWLLELFEQESQTLGVYRGEKGEEEKKERRKQRKPNQKPKKDT